MLFLFLAICFATGFDTPSTFSSNQMYLRPKPTVRMRFLALSASYLPAACIYLSFDWFTGSSMSFVIGYSDYFARLVLLCSGRIHLVRKSGNFGLKSNDKVIFRKFHSEIVEYLQRYFSFSVRNGTAEISLPFAKLSSFQSLINRKQ